MRSQDPSATEFLKLAKSFLPEVEIEALRRAVKQKLEAELDHLREEVARVEADLDALKPESANDTARIFARFREANLMSVAKLVVAAVTEQPGSSASEVIAFVLKQRPSVDHKQVHSELYRLSRPGGPETLRKEGDKPSSYFLAAPKSPEGGGG